MLVIDLTFEKLEATVKEFFKDYFASMSFFIVPEKLTLLFSADHGLYIYEYSFSLIEWDSHFKNGIEYHILENLKGQFVRSEETITLEHQKAAN